METVINRIEPVAIQTFAEENGLVMEVKERTPYIMKSMGMLPSDRFYAKFKDCEVLEGRVLGGVYGNGANPEQAMATYCSEIEGRKLIIRAYYDDRREINAPGRLYFRFNAEASEAPKSSSSEVPK